MKCIIWFLVYSPKTNDNLFDILFFNKSSDLESYVINNDGVNIIIRKVGSFTLKTDFIYEF